MDVNRDNAGTGNPLLPVARDRAAKKELKSRMLTNLYNACSQFLADANTVLDAAVAVASRWDVSISE